MQFEEEKPRRRVEYDTGIQEQLAIFFLGQNLNSINSIAREKGLSFKEYFKECLQTVADTNPGLVQVLEPVLAELQGRGVMGVMETSTFLNLDDITLIYNARDMTVTVNDRVITFTPMESKIFGRLMLTPSIVVMHHELLQAAYPQEYFLALDNYTSTNLKPHIRHMREKFGDTKIIFTANAGYSLTRPPEVTPLRHSPRRGV